MKAHLMIKPSSLVASTVPGEVFDPVRHAAFGDIFLEKYMSDPEEELAAVTAGAGLPDRADQGWLKVGSVDTESILKIFGNRIELYKAENNTLVGLPRIQVPKVMENLQAAGFPVENLTHHVGRIAVLGAQSRKLLKALGVMDWQLPTIGTHVMVDIIDEPVHICRSGFAGTYGYDFIIPIEVFNMVLAVICSWGVRLEMNLVPVGRKTIERLQE